MQGRWRALFHCLILLAWLTPAAVNAQPSCPAHLRIEFSDTTAACLTDFPRLSTSNPRGLFGSVQNLIPGNGLYTLAAAGGPSCQVHTVLHRAGSPGRADAVPAPEDRMVAECNDSRPASPDGACRCELVLSAGRSPLTQAEFVSRFAGSATTAVNVAPTPRPLPQGPSLPHQFGPQPSGTTPPVAAPAAPAAPVAATPATAPAVSMSELEALRREIDALRRAQQAAATNRSAPEVAVAPSRPKARALVIGNGNYTQFGRLANPSNDARAIAQKFRQMGFDVELILEATRERFVAALNQYSARSVGGDLDVLYYAGHGVQVDGINYLVPTDMSAQGITTGYLRLNGITLQSVLDYLPAKTRVVFLDACRDNPVARNLAGSRGGSAGLAPVSVATGTLIAYATRDGSTADDGTGPHSPYTAALLQHLDAPEDIGLVLRSVRGTVMRLTSNRQEPWEYGSLVGGSLVLSKVAR